MGDNEHRNVNSLSKVLFKQSGNSAIVINTQNGGENFGAKKSRDWYSVQDEGWAWVVLGACFYQTMVLFSFITTFGVQFGRFLTDLGVSSTKTTLISNSHLFIYTIMPIFAGPLCQHYGTRRVSFVSSILASLFFLSMVFAKSSTYIFFAYGIGMGIFSGMTNATVLLILPQYFLKRRGFALGVHAVAISSGQMVMPQVIRFFLDEYGFSGAVLVETGILLNCCVAATLLRPFKMKPDVSNREENREMLKSSNPHTEHVRLPMKIKQNLMKCATGFKSFRIISFSIAFSCYLVGYVNFLMLLPLYMVDAERSYSDAAWCLVIVAVSSTVSRVIISFFTDRKWYPKRAMLVVLGILASFVCFSIKFLIASTGALWGAMVVLGICSGVVNSLRIICLIDLIGMRAYVPALGTNGIVMGVTYIATGPFVGFLRDVTSSYAIALGACGVLMSVLALLWLLMPLAISADLRSSENQNEPDNDGPSRNI